MQLYALLVTFFISQTPWIFLSYLGSLLDLSNPSLIFFVGAVFIPGFILLIYKLLPPTYTLSDGTLQKRNLFFYMSCLFSWSCTIDLIIFFETLGYLHGFMDFYLKHGEPYLASPCGIFLNLWDAVVHYSLYLIIVYKYDNGQKYHSYGLYWCGSMLYGMFCLTIGASVGSYGKVLHPAMLLNIPYVILPIYALAYLLGMSSRTDKKYENPSLFDYLMCCGLIFSIGFGFLKGLAAFGSPLEIVQHYVADYEPYILEPGKFGMMHCVFNFVYGIPVQVLLIYGVLSSNTRWLKDLSLVYAGAVSQGTFVNLMSEISTYTHQDFRVTSNYHTVILMNLLVWLVAHLLLYQTCKRENKLQAKLKRK